MLKRTMSRSYQGDVESLKEYQEREEQEQEAWEEYCDDLEQRARDER